jgi:hypothetical protein
LPLGVGATISLSLEDFKKSQSDFDRQVVAAIEGLCSTSVLVTELQQGVEERMAKLQQLKAEHEKYSQLTQIEAEKAKALLQQVEESLGKEQRKERWIALAMHLGVGFLFFALGVGVGDPLKGWLLHAWHVVFS